MDDIKQNLKNYKSYVCKIKTLSRDLEVIEIKYKDSPNKFERIDLVKTEINYYEKLVSRIEYLLSKLEPTERQVMEMIFIERKSNKETLNELFYFDNVGDRNISFICRYKNNVLNKLKHFDEAS